MILNVERPGLCGGGCVGQAILGCTDADFRANIVAVWHGDGAGDCMGLEMVPSNNFRGVASLITNS